LPVEAAPHDPAECLNGTPSCITVRIRIPDDVRQVRDRSTVLQAPERFDHRVTRLIFDLSLQRSEQLVDHSRVVAERSKDTGSVLPNVRIATVEHLDCEGDCFVASADQPPISFNATLPPRIDIDFVGVVGGECLRVLVEPSLRVSPANPHQS
jgi:hypothetical protein